MESSSRKSVAIWLAAWAAAYVVCLHIPWLGLVDFLPVEDGRWVLSWGLGLVCWIGVCACWTRYIQMGGKRVTGTDIFLMFSVLLPGYFVILFVSLVIFRGVLVQFLRLFV